ncbi:MAG TPA: methyltransferase [Trebonia sp.]|nr:methyltransferase [Trebonia sp.]
MDAVPLGRLLDHLVTLGAFDHDEESGRYAVTEWGRQLRADDPHPMRFSLDLHNTVGRAQLAAVELLHTVTADEAGYTRMYGREFYTDLAENPALRASFDASMEQRIRGEVAELVKGFDWSRFRRLVDLGGGDGYLLASVLQAHPTCGGPSSNEARPSERPPRAWPHPDWANGPTSCRATSSTRFPGEPTSSSCPTSCTIGRTTRSPPSWRTAPSRCPRRGPVGRRDHARR